MDDPGLNEPIANGAKDVEQNQKHDEKAANKEDEQAFLAPSRWWFASTAFPLIAGTLGPMASAFSICALAVHWRDAIPGNGDEDTGVGVEDPKWLIGINAAQLVIALISNLFLLLNMAERVRFSIAQPITIAGWYISSIALVGLISTAAGPLQLPSPPVHVYSQAFYYAVFAAGLYFLVASLMVVTVYGASKGHYEREFKLTMSQRTLMLQTISFLVYLLAGAAVYAHIESWHYLDALYWADFTLLTVGIGDFAPETHLGRSLLFPFAIGGIVILGLVIGSIRSLVLERGKAKMGARMVEKERRRVLAKMQKMNGGAMLTPVTGEKRQATSDPSTTLDEQRQGMSERERREQEFLLMRQVQDHAATKRKWTSLVISGGIWFILWFAGAGIFTATERNQGWTYFQAVYFAYTSLLTIGFGDYYPQSNSGKPFFVFWSLLAVPSLTILISNMGDTVVKMIRDLTLWLGNLTVLPGEQDVKTNLKETAFKVTMGHMFAEDVDESHAGLTGLAKRHLGGRSNRREQELNDPESAAQVLSDDMASSDKRKASRNARTANNANNNNNNNKASKDMPKSRRHYHTILITEISRVMEHLHDNPPRKYTYDEWAWFLQIIGEDEDNPLTHRRAPQKPRADGEGLGAAAAAHEESVARWSWIGNRSPLMGNKDEPKWVLERLSLTLRRELEDMRREEEEEDEGEANTEEYNTFGQRQGAASEGLKKRTSRNGDSTDDSSRTAATERAHD